MITGLNGGDYFIMHKNIKSLFCIPEANIILCVNYNSIKNKVNKTSISKIFCIWPDSKYFKLCRHRVSAAICMTGCGRVPIKLYLLKEAEV